MNQFKQNHYIHHSVAHCSTANSLVLVRDGEDCLVEVDFLHVFAHFDVILQNYSNDLQQRVGLHPLSILYLGFPQSLDWSHRDLLDQEGSNLMDRTHTGVLTRTQLFSLAFCNIL